MIEEEATVVEVRGRRAWVETERKSACNHCSMSQGCGTASLDKWFGRRLSRIEAISEVGVSPGDRVVIGLRDRALVRGSLAVYLAPLLGLLLGALTGELLAPRLGWGAEATSIGLGLAGLVAGFTWLRRFAASVRHDRDFQAVILRRLHPTTEQTVTLRLHA